MSQSHSTDSRHTDAVCGPSGARVPRPLTMTPHHARVRGTAGRAVALFACAVRQLSFTSRKNSAPVSQHKLLVFRPLHVAGFLCACWVLFGFGDREIVSVRVSGFCLALQRENF
jgi:hypothetical protein